MFKFSDWMKVVGEASHCYMLIYNLFTVQVLGLTGGVFFICQRHYGIRIMTKGLRDSRV